MLSKLLSKDKVRTEEPPRKHDYLFFFFLPELGPFPTVFIKVPQLPGLQALKYLSSKKDGL